MLELHVTWWVDYRVTLYTCLLTDSICLQYLVELLYPMKYNSQIHIDGDATLLRMIMMVSSRLSQYGKVVLTNLINYIKDEKGNNICLL